MRIVSNSLLCTVFAATALILKAEITDVNYSECVDELYMPYPAFPGCNDTSLLCIEDQTIMENCCKCRCTAIDDPNNNSCYTPPTSPPSVQGLQNVSNQPSSSVITMILTSSSPAPSIPTMPEPTPPPTNYYENWQQSGGGAEQKGAFGRFIFVFFALFFFMAMVMKGNQLRTHRRHGRYRAARAERLRRAAMQQEGLVPNTATANGGDDAARYERIKSKFYFQRVLPDQSNVNPESLKLSHIETTTTTTTRTTFSGDVENGSRSSSKEKEDAEGNNKKTKEEATSETNEAEPSSEPSADDAIQEDTTAEESISMNQSASSIIVNKTITHHHHHPSLCEVISSWASVGPTSPPSDVCCICLEGYSVGDIICVAKKPTCDHLFHKDCVLEWMKTNDDCPLCRTNLLY